MLIPTVSGFDWESAIGELRSQKEIWSGFGVTDYVYSYHWGSCECYCCSGIDRFVYVEETSVTNVEYDESDSTYQAYQDECPSDDLDIADYDTMDSIFDQAIEYCQTHANITSTDSYYNDTSLEVTYDSHLGYPTLMVYNRKATAYCSY